MPDFSHRTPSDPLPPEDVFEPDNFEPAPSIGAIQRDASSDAANPYAEPHELVEVIVVEETPGPGFWEAWLWFFGFLIVHVIGGVLTAIGLLIYTVATSGISFGDRKAFEALLKETFAPQSILLILGEMGFFLLAAVAISLIRIGRQPMRKLGTALISPSHLALILAGAFPLMLFCGGLHNHLNNGWTELIKEIPALQFLDSTNTNTFMATLKDVPFILLVLAIAVGPAVGEEIVFRGVIGRGLTARYGVVMGVLLTSCFFAAAHVHPAHALAVLPLGIYVHVTYLATRSWLAPVLVHFINNSMAIVMLKMADSLKNNELADDAAQPVWVMIVAGIIALGAATALWKTRVEYLKEDGEPWCPGHATVERPPVGVFAIPAMRPTNGALYGAALVAACFMTGAFMMGIAAALVR